MQLQCFMLPAKNIKTGHNLDIKFTLPHAPGPNKKGAICIFVKYIKVDFPHPVFIRLGMYNFLCDYFIANVFFAFHRLIVSSKRLHKIMHSLICLTFLHCVFSNVSSNCLPERMHIHIGCICMIFLHCVSSNVSSIGLYEQMHSHTGCTYLI